MSAKSRRSIDEEERACYLCGRNGCMDPLDHHHVFYGKGNRKKSEQYGAVILLCHDRCHENGKEAVHKSKTVDRRLKQEFQEKLMAENGWSIEDFVSVFHNNYL